MYEPLKITNIRKTQSEIARETYKSLCQEFLGQQTSNPYCGYVRSCVVNNATIDRHVRSFELYAPYVRSEMRILDWGCRHAPDSCMLRATYPDVKLDGCDFIDEDFSVFHNYAQLSFTKLEHEFNLPYADKTFDGVISSGVLEHVGFEHESILEVWRILKDEGFFCVTFLPNRTSLTENLSRSMGSFCGHNRLYDLRQTRNMFLRSGFVIENYGFHQVLPTFGKSDVSGAWLNAIANLGAKFNRSAEAIPLLNAISANLFFILRKVAHM
jgi:ubiquinone/menaquinone biosynthesis C-methylase UbiE